MGYVLGNKNDFLFQNKFQKIKEEGGSQEEEGPLSNRRFTRSEVISSLPSSSGNPHFVHIVLSFVGKLAEGLNPK